MVLKGEGAEQFGVRRMLDAVVAEWPARLATLERQLFLINSRPGVHIDDTGLEEIGTGSGRFRLIVHLKTWHFFTFIRDRQSRLLVGRSLAELRDGGFQFLPCARQFTGAEPF